MRIKNQLVWMVIGIGCLGFGLMSFLPKPASSNPATTKPNILFIIADDAGADMGAYGRKWVNTPAFDRIAREGLLFNRAYTPNAKCAPSRSCILTGRNSWQLDAAVNHIVYFPTKFKTFMESLADAGYTIGYTGKGYAPGKALTVDGQPRNLTGPLFDKHTTTPPTEGISANDYAANFDAFVSQTGNKPWTFWVGLWEPHRGFEYGSGVKKGGKRTDMIERVPAYWPDSLTIRNDLLDYAYEIEYMDSHIARILKKLEQIGQLDNTLIVVTSDHGMPFPRVKGNQYENSNHIPLAIRWPGGIRKPNRVIDDYVSFIDLAPTFLQAAGISARQSGMEPITGTSLFDIFASDGAGQRGVVQVNPARNFVLVGQERHDMGRPNDVGYPVRGIHKDGMLYLANYEPDRWPVCNPETGYLNCDGSPTKSLILNLRRSGQDKTYWQTNFGKRPAEEFYDVRRDPDCVKNLANDPKYRAKANQLKAEMVAKLKAQNDLRQIGMGHLYEQYPSSDPKFRGFYENYMTGKKTPTPWVNASDYEPTAIDD